MARHHAVMGHEMGNAVNIRLAERGVLSILAKQVCGYYLSMGC
jgi:hypothetical protein